MFYFELEVSGSELTLGLAWLSGTHWDSRESHVSEVFPVDVCPALFQPHLSPSPGTVPLLSFPHSLEIHVTLEISQRIRELL